MDTVLSKDGKSVETTITTVTSDTKENLLMRKQMVQNRIDRDNMEMAKIDKKLSLFPEKEV